ncbi:hypothetical conserved protein (plasmid) [Geobacillus kaustophilus HTA426]|uniref:Hypothetical conserved protein n=1 Tax=Geobacillus kaustophilus (strain HTA426) TaxID=235909 RepID=Q5QL45_GEOKA|nr:nucleotidyltransferase family protein [Geobacillus kaustophilus]BAD74265.1 hypothetical conserved protein [Geobacillus kaustophilus HTA426]
MKVWAVILAAGVSKRMGYPKTLLPFNGKSIIRHVIKKALSSNVDGIIAVINPNVRGLEQEVKETGVKVVINQYAENGMSSSLWNGLKALPNEVEATLILLGDQPGVDPWVINKIIKTYEETRSKIIQPTYQGIPGHPVLFDQSLFPYLYEVRGDQGGREVIQKFLSERVLIETGQSLLKDIDTWEDYIQLIKSSNQKIGS